MEFKDRLRLAMKEKGITSYRIGMETSVSRQSVDSYLKGTIPQSDTIAILADYLGVTSDWLISGEEDAPNKNVKTLTLYDVDAAAGYESFDVMISKEKVVGEFVVPTFASADWMIHVRGSSMYPKYSSGDIIACKVIKESRFIQWNKIYVIATREQGLLVKRIMPSEKEDCIKAVSDNEKYPPFDIPKDEIFGLALVLGAIKLE